MEFGVTLWSPVDSAERLLALPYRDILHLQFVSHIASQSIGIESIFARAHILEDEIAVGISCGPEIIAVGVGNQFGARLLCEDDAH